MQEDGWVHSPKLWVRRQRTGNQLHASHNRAAVLCSSRLRRSSSTCAVGEDGICRPRAGAPPHLPGPDAALALARRRRASRRRRERRERTHREQVGVRGLRLGGGHCNVLCAAVVQGTQLGQRGGVPRRRGVGRAVRLWPGFLRLLFLQVIRLQRKLPDDLCLHSVSLQRARAAAGVRWRVLNTQMWHGGVVLTLIISV